MRESRIAALEARVAALEAAIGTGDHQDLTNRDAEACHPDNAIEVQNAYLDTSPVTLDYAINQILQRTHDAGYLFLSQLGEKYSEHISTVDCSFSGVVLTEDHSNVKLALEALEAYVAAL